MGEGYGTDGGKGASQAYWNAFKKLQRAWREVLGEDLDAIGTRAMEVYENALETIRDRLKKDGAGEGELRSILDIEPQEDLGEALLGVDLDQLAPNTIKQAIREEIDRHRSAGDKRLPLRPILRSVLDQLFSKSSFRRPHVGANRHWPRLLQYLRELEEETDWSPDGRGLRLANAGGRGPVAQEPRDPGRLSVVIDPDYLWPLPKD